MNYSKTALFFFLSLSISSYAQNDSMSVCKQFEEKTYPPLTGLVVDITDNAPIIGAVVEVDGHKVDTDLSGSFSVATGGHDKKAIVYCIGYWDRHVLLKHNMDSPLVIKLSPAYCYDSDRNYFVDIEDIPEDVKVIVVQTRRKTFLFNKELKVQEDSGCPDEILLYDGSGILVHPAFAGQLLKRIKNRPMFFVDFDRYELNELTSTTETPTYTFVLQYN